MLMKMWEGVVAVGTQSREIIQIRRTRSGAIAYRDILEAIDAER
ncbi:hypothetical protein CCP3SC1AL1_160013 [Gammaproteobacteria bacterium]